MNRNDVHKGYISKMSLHDRELLGAIVGLAKTCGNNPYTDDTIKLICDALLAFNEGCDKAQAEEWLERLHKEKYNISPGCAVCQARCGNTDDYDISLILGEEQDKLDIKQELIVQCCSRTQLCETEACIRMKRTGGYCLGFLQSFHTRCH